MKPKEEEKKNPALVMFAVLGYMACSALMLIVNKLAVKHLPNTEFVIFCQLVSSGLAMFVVGSLGIVQVDPMEISKIKQFWIVPIAFLLTIWANMHILAAANVETFITFRASTPLLISVADYIFLGRELPNTRSLICLLVLLIGAVGYVLNDKFFEVRAYLWVAVWFIVFSFDQIYIKHAVTNVKMTTWGQVYYTNTLASVPLFFYLVGSGDLGALRSFEWTNSSILWLSVSCAMGVAIAYFSFLARGAVSATYFTVIGNTCKVITVFINVVMWDQHATPNGLASLFLCLIGAYFYQQAPLREGKEKKKSLV